MELLSDWELTANHFVAFPCIGPGDGSIDSINILHRGALGALEWSARDADSSAGDPLLRPVISVDGEVVSWQDPIVERLERWIPRFRARLTETLSLTATICAPTGYDAGRRGAVYSFEIENRGEREQNVRVALEGRWKHSLAAIGMRRHLPGRNRLVRAPDIDALALEMAGPHAAALAVATWGNGAEVLVDANGEPLAPGKELVVDNGQLLEFTVARTVRVGAGKRVLVPFYLAVAPEREGAFHTAAALHRVGGEQLVRETRLELARLIRRAEDPVLTAMLNRHLLFAFFFGVARAIDDERLHPVTSRSPLHSRCATFNERDTLLWCLPAFAYADAGLAREVLLRCFEQHSHRAGERVHYLDGSVQRPGFALDHWCAYGIALEQYSRITGDASVFDEPLVADVMRELDAGFYARLHPEVFLVRTELLPSGDPADQPYTTFGNALAVAFCRAAQRCHPEQSPERARLATAAEELRSAIWRRCNADLDSGPVLAWSTDLEGSAAVYDDPAGSLRMLPFYGFCEPNEPLYRDTMEFLRSDAYALWLGRHKFPGLAHRDTPEWATTAALCSELIAGEREQALQTLRGLSLDRGLVATHYQPDTGAPTGERHDAALSGFLAWALLHTNNT